MRHRSTSHTPQSWACLIGIAVVMAGCYQPGAGKRVEALLRVTRQGESTTADYMIYRETQASLLKSDYVLRAALRRLDAEEAKTLSVEWLSKSLEVDVEGESELISVRLPLAGREPEEAAIILNGVLDAYQAEIVNKERLEQVDTLSKLRKRYAILFDSIKKKTDEVRKLAKQLGTPDVARVKFANSLHSKKLASIHRRLLDLQLREIELVREIELDQDTNDEQLEVVQKQIELLREQESSEVKELVRLGSSTGELQARTDDLGALRKDLASVRKSMSELEIEIDGPARVIVIQSATVRGN